MDRGQVGGLEYRTCVLPGLRHALVASRFCRVHRQGGGAGEEPAAAEGADRTGQPPGAGGQFHSRGAGTAHRVQGHSADPLRQSERKPQGLSPHTHTHPPPTRLLLGRFFACVCVCVRVRARRGTRCSVSQPFRFDVAVEGSKSGVWRRWRTGWWT